MKPDTTILITPHGSHLYGLNHSESDLDMFRVVHSRDKARVMVRGGIDYTEIGVDAFLTNVFNGSHQSVEALFSPRKWVHPDYEPYLARLRVTGEGVFSAYRRTIHAFAKGDRKQRRHAVRLGWNLKQLRETGRCDPVMSPAQIQSIVMLAELYSGGTLEDIAINL